MYKELKEVDERVRQKFKRPDDSVLPSFLGFKTAADSGGFMVCVASSRQQTDAAIASMRELYATFVPSEGNPFYAGKKVALEVVEYNPKFEDALVFISLQKLKNKKTGV